MTAGHAIFIAIGLLVAAFGVWRYLPKSILYFKPSRIIGTFHENADLDPAPAERAREDVESITSLGFTRAGVQVEKPPLWHKPLEVLILSGNEGKELACVISGKRHVTWYFETIFEGGQLVITSAGGFKPTNEGGLYQSVQDAEAVPAEVLARHRDNVAHYVSEGFVPVKRYTPDVIGDMTRLYYGFPVVRRGMRTYGSMNTVPLFILCVPLILALVKW